MGIAIIKFENKYNTNDTYLHVTPHVIGQLVKTSWSWASVNRAPHIEQSTSPFESVML